MNNSNSNINNNNNNDRDGNNHNHYDKTRKHEGTERDTEGVGQDMS